MTYDPRTQYRDLHMRIGTATLSGGTVTVNNTAVTADSIIIVTPQGGSVNVGTVWVSGRVAGESFTISSSNVLDARTVGWLME